MKEIKTRQNIGFEIQIYNKNGSNKHVIQCDNMGEVAQVLARNQWAAAYPLPEYPNYTIWYNGEPWCKHEYTEIPE